MKKSNQEKMSNEELKWKEMMDFLVINNEKYSDEQWAERFNLACKEIPVGTEITHSGCNKVITERVIKYCKEKEINLEDYDGPMPYRHFKIPVNGKN
jgi:uncharacterized membrane protein